MEMIILITVLATLGVVAVVTATVVAFVKLKKKVDVNDFDRENENIYNEFDKRFENLISDLERHVTEIYQQMNQEDDETRRFIDSRCDKLDTKIKDLDDKFVRTINYNKKEIETLKNSNNNMPASKQLLTD